MRECRRPSKTLTGRSTRFKLRASTPPGSIWTRSPGQRWIGRGCELWWITPRDGDVIVVHTLDRLGRTVRDTLNLIHELAGRGVGVRTWPTRSRSTRPTRRIRWLSWLWCYWPCSLRWNEPMLERAAHARAVATAKGRRVGRPSVVNPNQLDYASRLRDEGLTIAQIVEKTGITRTSLYRHLPPRPAIQLTAAPNDGEQHS